MPMRPYIVRQGDYLDALAFRFGFDASDVWNDPKNAELKELRADPNVLFPGDLIWLPPAEVTQLEVTPGAVNEFVAEVPTVPVRIQIRGVDGKPLANESYAITGDADPPEGSTDGEGWISFRVAVHCRSVEVVLPQQSASLHVQVGQLDPAAELSGAAQRLRQLGYFSGELPEQNIGLALTGALSDFQAAEGLPQTGVLDEDTADKLAARFGA